MAHRPKMRAGFAAALSAALATGLAGGLAVGLAAPPPAAGASSSAASLYRQALATTTAWSVHYASQAVSSKMPILVSGDAGPASGTQEILVGSGATADQASLVVIGDFTYFKGNAVALQNLILMPASMASTDAGQWVLFSSSNPLYAQVVDGVRSHDVSQEIALKGPYTLGPPRQLDGVAVDTIRGTLDQQGAKPTPAALYIRTGGRHLIVEEDSVGANGAANAKVHIVFSKWGEKVKPLAPDATIRLGQISTT
jgi:hypothetical protein